MRKLRPLNLEYLRSAGGGKRTDRLAYTPNWETGCWEWRGAKDVHGYGRRNVNGKGIRAHRLMYENLVGLVPEGLVLDHLCRNKLCVNPIHLEPVTITENVGRGVGREKRMNEALKTTGAERMAACVGVMSGDPIPLWQRKLNVNRSSVEKWLKRRGYCYRPMPSRYQSLDGP